MTGTITEMVRNTIEEEKMFVTEGKECGGRVKVQLDHGGFVWAQCSPAQFNGHKIGNRVIVRPFGSMYSL
jgi:hypothetical protein